MNTLPGDVVDAPAILRGIADQLEMERELVGQLRKCLAGLVANCPWVLDMGGTPAFWLWMRRSQALLKDLENQ